LDLLGRWIQSIEKTHNSKTDNFTKKLLLEELSKAVGTFFKKKSEISKQKKQKDKDKESTTTELSSVTLPNPPSLFVIKTALPNNIVR
jgi:hypothetical protein